MYKALHKPSGHEIVILDREWVAQVAYLRSLDRKDALVCPGCQQPVRVRAGRVRRWHFAHKHLGNCPYDRASPMLLDMRAVLYTWLQGQFGEGSVSIEMQLDLAVFQRPVDCWVETEGLVFPYWLVDRRMPPDERHNLAAGFEQLGLVPHYVFASDMLRPDSFQPRSRVHLTTTERAFLQTTTLDPAWQVHFEHLGGSLHYLDPGEALLTTYRDLVIFHPPQLYHGTRLQHPLAEVQASLATGEFTHPGELEHLQKRQEAVEARQRKVEDRLRRARDFFTATAGRAGTLSYPKERSVSHTPFRREGTCKFCGRLTSDWVQYDGDSGMCICRDCKDNATTEGTILPPQ